MKVIMDLITATAVNPRMKKEVFSTALAIPSAMPGRE
jgi:hypothetical protein